MKKENNSSQFRYAESVSPETVKSSRISKKDWSSILFFVGLLIFCYLFAGCKKENDIGFRFALNKKWQTVSQVATPSCTNPATGKTYTDLFEFPK